MSKITMYREEIRVRGKTFMVDSVKIDNSIIILTGKYIKTGKIKDEWYQFEGIQKPELIVDSLEKNAVKPDIFTFMQRLPDSQPKYNYYKKWESIAVVAIKSYDYWFENQVGRNVRKSIRKAERMGIVVKVVDFNDELVRGIKDIYNETPIRQGKPFWHYGKDFETIKKEAATYLNRSEFIGAYYKDELIGFIKLVYIDKCASMMHIISKIKHNNKAPANALLAKTVEICDKEKIAYLYYGEWSKGTLGDFKRYNGFEKVDLPRYYIPLTLKGKMFLKLNLHLGVAGILPEKLLSRLIDLKKKWYERKLSKI